MLIASLLVNAWIILTVDIDDRQVVTTEVANIQVNLMALAAPAAKPTPVPVVKKAQPKSAISKVVTHSNALKNINTKKVSHKNKEKNKKQVDTQSEHLVNNQNIEKEDIKVIPPKELPRPAKQKLNKDTMPALASLDDHSGNQQTNVIREARFRSQTPPVYPRRSYELGQEGTVILLAEVANNGKPKSLKIEASSGYRLLDSAAMAAVKKWEFETAHMNSRLSASWVRVPVRFVIQ